ncbi:hypothetical protein EJ08DRAFT_666761 [Tothia fuscella]|uniref:Uncharacterized protein n=1 Tax=Tothia fuscella TaxID=1048955 RepID=A0A9P4NDS6_9PEZI|nr:hypothetical protein EJ08DRAFT_666761 [Tothia fuscella]
MEGRHLPGFYWDIDKKKYFKLQPGRLAPTGSKYTLENVQKEREESRKRKRDEGRAKERQQYLSQTNKALRTPSIVGTGVTCETGLKRIDEMTNIRAQAFIRGLEQHTSLNLKKDATNLDGILPIRAEYEILSFDYDKETKGLILGITKKAPELDSLVSVMPNDNSTWPTWFAPNPAGDVTNRTHYSIAKLRSMMHFQSTISSTQLTPSRTLVTTSTGSRYSPTIHLTQLLDPTNAASSQPLDAGVSTLLRPPNVNTIWTSAPNPYSTYSTESIAIGSSNGISILTNESGTWRSSAPVETHSDVLALDWLSANTLAAGLRDATVMLYDARSRGSVKRLRHKGAVTGIKRADHESRVVVAGLGNEMGVYDLRMLRDVLVSHAAAKLSHSSKKKGKKRGRGPKEHIDMFGRDTAQSVVRFEYDNEFLYPLGFDVHADLGLVAAGEKDGHVQVWSLRTGERVRKLDIRAEGQGDDVVKCLRFVEDERGTTKLMASCGGRIVEYLW